MANPRRTAHDTTQGQESKGTGPESARKPTHLHVELDEDVREALPAAMGPIPKRLWANEALRHLLGLESKLAPSHRIRFPGTDLDTRLADALARGKNHG